MLHGNKNSLAHRLTFRVIVFSTMVAVVATTVQLYFDYRQELRSIRAFFAAVKDTSLRPLEESVWILDELQVNLQLEGLTKRQDIVYASVEMDHQTVWAKGIQSRQRILTHSFPLIHQVRGGAEEIGILHVTASLEGVYNRLLRRVIVLLASNAVKTFLVAGFILLLFKRNIAVHLERLADYVQSIDLQHLEPPPPLQLDRPAAATKDELDQVSASLSALCQSGYRAYCDLRVQEQRLRLFFDAAEEAVFGVDAQGRCTFINRAGCEQFLVADSQELVGVDLLAWLGRDGYGQTVACPLGEQVRETIDRSKVLLSDEMPLARRDGSTVLIALRSYPVLEHDQCAGAIAFFADISRQQKLELEKQLFAKIVRQAPALIVIVDADGMIEYVNASFEQIIGVAARELVGRRALDSFPTLGVEQHIEHVRAKIHNAETWIGAFVSNNADGRRITLEAAIFPIFDRRGQLTNIVAMGRDITREQQLTEQLHHAQKMEAIGKLAASIAHEFGNPLLGIRFALRDVQQRAGLNPEDGKLLQLAENECDRMRKLIRDLQQFNRPSTGKKTEFDPRRILEEILALHQNLLAKKKIAVVRDFDRCCDRLQAVEDQIRQVFINLIINASDAMAAGGGTLTLGTAMNGEEIVFSVGDTGAGVAQENLERIFEPFFTTKSAVEGTGLGLPVSYGIVRAHGGVISVQSEPGKTVFTVRLPLAPRGAQEPPKAG